MQRLDMNCLGLRAAQAEAACGEDAIGRVASQDRDG